jgi:hypothetical protein
VALCGRVLEHGFGGSLDDVTREELLRVYAEGK